MLLREIFAARGKTATSSMVRVVKTPSGYIRFQEWQAQEQARLEASKRIPTSGQEQYDYSQRAPQSQKLGYDFSQ